MTGKERYEQRRQQEHDNEMARLRMQNAHYVKEAETREVADLAIRALRAFILGEAFLEIMPGNVGTSVKFVMPQVGESVESNNPTIKNPDGTTIS